MADRGVGRLPLAHAVPDGQSDRSLRRRRSARYRRVAASPTQASRNEPPSGRTTSSGSVSGSSSVPPWFSIVTRAASRLTAGATSMSSPWWIVPNTETNRLVPSRLPRDAAPRPATLCSTARQLFDAPSGHDRVAAFEPHAQLVATHHAIDDRAPNRLWRSRNRERSSARALQWSGREVLPPASTPARQTNSNVQRLIRSSLVVSGQPSPGRRSGGGEQRADLRVELVFCQRARGDEAHDSLPIEEDDSRRRAHAISLVIRNAHGNRNPGEERIVAVAGRSPCSEALRPAWPARRRQHSQIAASARRWRDRQPVHWHTALPGSALRSCSPGTNAPRRRGRRPFPRAPSRSAPLSGAPIDSVNSSGGAGWPSSVRRLMSF